MTQRENDTCRETWRSRVNWRVNDFCKAHGIGRSTFYDEVKRGEIKTMKIGNRTLVPDSEARKWQCKKEGVAQ